MPSTNDILQFGRDAGLLHTRSLILSMDGFRTDCVNTLLEVKDCLAKRPYGLLMLCHSLPVAERDVAISIATSLVPVINLLALQRYAAGESHPPLTQVLHMQSGPEGLRSAVLALATPARMSLHSQQRMIAMAQFEAKSRGSTTSKDTDSSLGMTGDRMCSHTSQPSRAMAISRSKKAKRSHLTWCKAKKGRRLIRLGS